MGPQVHVACPLLKVCMKMWCTCRGGLCLSIIRSAMVCTDGGTSDNQHVRTTTQCSGAVPWPAALAKAHECCAHEGCPCFKHDMIQCQLCQRYLSNLPSEQEAIVQGVELLALWQLVGCTHLQHMPDLVVMCW